MNELRVDADVVHDFLKAQEFGKAAGLVISLFSTSVNRFAVQIKGDETTLLMTHDVRELNGFVHGWEKRQNHGAEVRPHRLYSNMKQLTSISHANYDLIKKHIADRNIILAIKTLRQITNLGLKEAKEAVENADNWKN